MVFQGRRGQETGKATATPSACRFSRLSIIARLEEPSSFYRRDVQVLQKSLTQVQASCLPGGFAVKQGFRVAFFSKCMSRYKP